MDKKFLHKVLGQIVSETRIDYDGEIQFPFSPFPTSPSPFLRLLSSPVPPLIFTKHCEDVYGLNEDEVSYVWKEYRDIIKDEINNG